MTTAVAANPRTKTWTRQEYYQMADLGWFNGQRAELVEGEIFVLSPQNFRHSSAVDRAFRVIDRAIGSRYWVRAQLPMQAGPTSEPEPDISAVPGQRDDYTDHPEQAVLVVEVSDSTVYFDRKRKASLYASRNIQDYWVLNLVDDQLEVFRNPKPDSTATSQASYDLPIILKRGDAINPLADTTISIRVDDLLGRRAS